MIIRWRAVVLYVASWPVAMALAVGLHAQTDAQAWVPVVGGDLVGTPDLANRTPATLDLVQTGDFNSDGLTDRASVVRDHARQRYGIVICLSRAEGACVEQLIASGPFDHVKTLGVRKVSLSEARRALSAPRHASSLGTLSRSPASEFLRVFAFEASDAFYLWTGTGFDRVQVTD